jgi:hypothetical protein
MAGCKLDGVYDVSTRSATGKQFHITRRKQTFECHMFLGFSTTKWHVVRWSRMRFVRIVACVELNKMLVEKPEGKGLFRTYS